MIEEKKRPLLRSPHSGEEIADSDEIQRCLDRLAPEGLEGASFPIIQWEEFKAKGCFVVQVLCRTRDGIELHEFFCEMLRRRLVFGRYFPLKQTQMWMFNVEEEEFYLGEVTLLVDRGKEAKEAREHFSLLVPEIRLGLTSKSWAWDLLQTHGLAPHRKVDLVHQGMLSILRRYPNAFDRTILEDVQHFLLLTAPEYREIRSVPHLCRIIYSLHMLRGETRRALQLDHTSRQLTLRVMRAPLFYAFGKKRVLGIAIALSVLLNYELLDGEHVAKAVKQLTPRLTLLEGSFFCYQHPNDPIRAVYFEVESVEGPPPSGEEVAKLRKELAGELKGRVERLAHPVFNPRNEEEIFRTVMSLAQEIRYVRDLPQLSLTFRGQGRRSMTWNVIVVRLWIEPQPTLETLAKRLPAGIEFVLDDEFDAGYLRKRYRKRASVFALNFDREPFLRRDSSIDLPRARQFVVRLLTGILGEMRDFTGGLMIKQREMLSATRNLLAPHEQKQDFLLEHLFYNITPSVMQSYLDPQLVRVFFQLLLEVRERPLPRGEHYIMRSDRIDEAELVMVRSEDGTYKNEVEGAVGTLGYQSHELATARFYLQGSYYMGYLCPHTETDSRQLAKAIEGALKGWSCRLKSEQTIRINLPRLARTFDPRTSVDRRSGVLMKMLYEGLICLDDKGRPTPGVAHTYEISPDGKTYTFHLRRCFWTNGEAVTADDFEYTWKKVLDPQFDSQFAYFLFPIRGAQEAKEGKLPISSVGVYAQGEQKLVVELDHITPHFLELCSHWIYLPLHRGIDKDRPGSTQTARADLVCNGPFRIASAPLHGELKLVKNALYWDEKHVSLDRISILSIDDPYTAMTLFETGNLDWVGAPLCDLPTRAMPTLKQDRRLHSVSSTAMFRVEFNVDSFPFSSKKVRQAFAAAIDRQRVVDEALGSGELPAFQLLPSEWTKEQTRTVNIFDPQLAQTLLAEGLGELGLKELPPIVFNYPLIEDQGAVIEAIAKQWKQILGMNIVLEGVPWRSYNEHILSQPTQVVAMMWYTWIVNPYYAFEALRFRVGRFNASRWEDPDFQQLMDQLDATLEEKLRHELLFRLQQIILDHVPVIPIYLYHYRYLCSPSIQGATITPIGQMDFKAICIDRKEPSL